MPIPSLNCLTVKFPVLVLMGFALLLSACASYDGRLNSTTTQYLGTNGSIVSRTSNLSVMERESYWEGDGASGAPPS